MNLAKFTSLMIAALLGFAALAASENSTDPQASGAFPPFTMKKSETQGAIMESPDRKTYIVNKRDDHDVWQVYLGKHGSTNLVCLTDTQQPGGPKGDHMKMQAHWHPSGRWILMAVERDEYTPPPILGSNRDFVKGMLQCGLWTDMWAMSPDGKRWHRLTNFKSNKPGVADGFTGPALTSDGTKAVWSQVVDGNILVYYPFGKWELICADFEERDGIPRMVNQKDITPKGMHWNEPGNFHPDNVSLLITGSTEKDAQGMDQYILNIKTGELKNLTNSPTVWDEHGVFSPDGEQIIFMSAWPYRDDPNSSKTLSIKTEFMIMNKDGTGLTQLTHFKEKGYPESSEGIAACAGWLPNGHILMAQLVFPEYVFWELTFNDKHSGTGKPRTIETAAPASAETHASGASGAVAAAEKKYKTTVEFARKEYLSTLKAEMSRLAANGDVDGAMKVGEKMKALESDDRK